jgi:alpha-glucosidase
VNFHGEPAAVAVAGEWRVEVASDGRGEGAPFTGALGPDAALVLRQASG